jgi:hypothetical protein
VICALDRFWPMAPEIDHKLQRGFSRLGKRLRRDDGADADIDGKELVETDLRRRRRVLIGELVHGDDLAELEMTLAPDLSPKIAALATPNPASRHAGMAKEIVDRS